MGHPLILGSVTYQLSKMASIKGWDKLDDSIMLKLMGDIARSCKEQQ